MNGRAPSALGHGVAYLSLSFLLLAMEDDTRKERTPPMDMTSRVRTMVVEELRSPSRTVERYVGAPVADMLVDDCACACPCALSCPNIEATGHRWIWLVDHDKAERSQRGIALRCENLRHQGGRKRSVKVKMQSLVPNTYPCQPHTVNLVSHGQFGSKFLQGQSQQPD